MVKSVASKPAPGSTTSPIRSVRARARAGGAAASDDRADTPLGTAHGGNDDGLSRAIKAPARIASEKISEKKVTRVRTHMPRSDCRVALHRMIIHVQIVGRNGEAYWQRGCPIASGSPPWRPSPWSAARCALQPPDRLLERGEESRAVARRERSRPARDLAGGAKVVHQVAHRQRHAD